MLTTQHCREGWVWLRRDGSFADGSIPAHRYHNRCDLGGMTATATTVLEVTWKMWWVVS